MMFIHTVHWRVLYRLTCLPSCRTLACTGSPSAMRFNQGDSPRLHSIRHGSRMCRELPSSPTSRCSIHKHAVIEQTLPSDRSDKNVATEAPPAVEGQDSGDHIECAHVGGEQSNIASSVDVPIYEGSLSTMVRGAKLFSLCTSIIALGLQSIVIQYATQPASNKIVAAAGGSMLLIYTFVTPILMHFLSKRYVTRMTHRAADDTYTATTYSLFLRHVQTRFTADDVVVPAIPGPFTTFHAITDRRGVESAEMHQKGGNAKRAFYILPENFDDPVHHGRIMQYDKPLNIRQSEAAQ